MPEGPTDSVLSAFRPLARMPMWSASWAGDIAWFQFGKAVLRLDRHGNKREVGEYALHVSCTWQWRSNSGVVRADHETADLRSLGELRARFREADLAESGLLTFHFDNGDTLAIEPDESDDKSAEETEHWRFFQPGLQTPHVVASNLGVEWHEA
jgi:hypothetical protein